MDFGDDVFIDDGFGMGMGNDIIIDNGFGNQVVIDQGWGMGGNLMVGNGYGMGGTEVIVQNDGFFGRQEEIIMTNNYGSTTIIEQQRGIFGTREQVILTGNNGWGMGTTTVIENRPFGSNEVIINNGYNNPVLMGYGGYGGYARTDVVCLPNCTCQICISRRITPAQNVVVCLPNCTCQICIGRRIGPGQNVQPLSVPVGQPIYKQEVHMKSPYEFEERGPKQQDLLASYNILELKFEKWCPRQFILTNRSLDKYVLPAVRKMKCRTNYEPFSNSLENGQIILKVVIATQDIFIAATSKIIKEYFIKAILARLQPNHLPLMPEFQGEMCGSILKKSQFLGNWQVRQVKITKEQGLKSYKKASQIHTLHIQSIKQIWTWFQTIQGNYLVIKVKNKIKTEFGIPINQQLGLWLSAFYSLLQDYQ